MTECEKCPNWGKHPEHGGYTCLVRYCIDDPWAEIKYAEDERWEIIEQDRKDAEELMRAEAAEAERQMYEDAFPELSRELRFNN